MDKLQDKILLWDFTNPTTLTDNMRTHLPLSNSDYKTTALELNVKNLSGWLDNLCTINELPAAIKDKFLEQIAIEIVIPELNSKKKSKYQEFLLAFITRDQLWYELPKQALQPGENIIYFKIPDPDRIKNFKKLKFIINSDIPWNTNIYIKNISGIVNSSTKKQTPLWPFDTTGDTQGFIGNVCQSREYYSRGIGSLKVDLKTHKGWDENSCMTTMIPEILHTPQNSTLCFDCYYPPQNKKKPTDFFLIHILATLDDNDSLELGKINILPGWNYCRIDLNHLDTSQAITKIKFAFNSSYKINSNIYLSNFILEEKQ